VSRNRVLLTIVLVAAAAGLGVFAAQFFPRPDVDKDLWSPAQRFPRPALPETYIEPATDYPAGRAVAQEYVDVAALTAALAAAAYLALKKRSRTAIFALMLASLAYFGFYRGGCVCPIGAIQHVAEAAFDSRFALPAAVLIFFALPLVAALFFGRVFCSAVCPLGAMQDVVLLRPMKRRAPATSSAATTRSSASSACAATFRCWRSAPVSSSSRCSSAGPTAATSVPTASC